MILLIFLFEYSSSQPYQVNGYVQDRATGDLLPNAHVFVLSEKVGLVANAYGYFSFTVHSETVQLMLSFTGYDQLEKKFRIYSDTTIVCGLTSNNQLGEVEIIGKQTQMVVNREVGSIKLTGREIEKIPSLLGEKDLVKALQLMPGIKMGKEGTSGLYIRGGTPGQNLMLLDGIPVYNVNHLFGFFSVFTPEAVKSVDVYKGAFPSRNGGRISSVIDVKMREGNLRKPQADVTVGLISSKVIVETPLEKGKSSLLIAARRTYADLLLAPFLNSTSYDGKTKTQTGYHFYDVNVKFFRDMGDYGRLYFSNYFGRDKQYSKQRYREYPKNGITETGLSVSEISGYTYNWGNFTSSLRWNLPIGKRLFLNSTLFWTNYTFNNNIKVDTEKYYPDSLSSTAIYSNHSGVKDYGYFTDFDYYWSSSNQLSFGTRLIRHQFVPSKVTMEFMNSEGAHTKTDQTAYSHALELNTYLEEKLNLFRRWEIVAGVHHAWFKIGENDYSTFQPRIRTSIKFKQWSLKGSFGHMVQPVQSIVNNSNMLAVDIWVPSEGTVKPSSSFQFDLGATWYFFKVYSFTAESYWRKMNNIITYRSGESFLSLYENWYDKVVTGRGESYGLELMAQKHEGNTTGWIAYTWSKSIQQFEALNNGKAFPFSFDRRHYLTLSMNHRFTDKMQISANWIFATGEPITLSTTAYQGDQFYGYRPMEFDYLGIIQEKVHAPNQIIYINGVNNFRLPSYHRLDLSVDLTREKNRGIRTWSFSVYNAYARNNPFMVRLEENSQGKMELQNSTFFRLVPSVSYQFKFQ